MKLLLDEHGVAVFYGDTVSYLENGFQFNDIIFANKSLSVIDVTSVPSDFVPSKYCYNATNGFFPNPDYFEPVNVNQVLPGIIKNQNAILKALDGLILGV